MDALPAELRQEVLMSAAALDGHSLATHRFRSPAPPAALARDLRDRWREQGLAVVETRQGDWTILSIRDPAGLQTVQLRAAAGGTEGLSSRWDRAPGVPPAGGELTSSSQAAVSPPTLRWLDGDARIVRRVAHRDPGRSASTVVALVAGPPSVAAERLRERARASGFADERPASAQSPVRAEGQALAFRRGDEEVVATVAVHRDGAAIVLHWSASR
jgi:hypothetical protein